MLSFSNQQALGCQLVGLIVSCPCMCKLLHMLPSLCCSDCALYVLQYGGSEAHSTFFQRQRGDWEAATQSRDFLTSIRRFYSNTYTDSEKQVASESAACLAR
jgi:hypothetical protein